MFSRLETLWLVGWSFGLNGNQDDVSGSFDAEIHARGREPRQLRSLRERRCPEGHAISALAALAQPTRLAIFRLLVKHEPVGITAGVIAETVGAPHNTLSSHLAILVRAGLLRSSREGRTIIYRSDVEGMRSVIAFLVNDCCDGHPELCNLVAADAAPAARRLRRKPPRAAQRSPPPSGRPERGSAGHGLATVISKSARSRL